MDSLAVYKNIFNLENRLVLITGGYGHLGKGMVRALMAFNAEVVVTGLSKEKFENAFSQAERAKLIFRKMDIEDSASISTTINDIREQYNRIDILINNAYSIQGNSQEKLTDQEWNSTMNGTVGSVHKTMREVIPIMKENGYGKIVNIASMYGLVSPNFSSLYIGEDCQKYTNPPHYGAAKAAVIQLTKYYAAHLGQFKIYVNAIAPGPFPSPSIKKENPAFIKRLNKNNPLNMIGTPLDLAGALILLCSSASDFITGQVLQVDGGWTIW